MKEYSFYRLVLEGVSREHAITRLVTSHVPKAEKARRHGRELSFILPHNAVENFAPLFSAIENEINTRASRLGISSYGVSMTTLEEVRTNIHNLARIITDDGIKVKVNCSCA
jgi:ATP-binding cassette subfamily A (ABC1) protein 5